MRASLRLANVVEGRPLQGQALRSFLREFGKGPLQGQSSLVGMLPWLATRSLRVCWDQYLSWKPSLCQEFRLFKPFRLSFFRMQDSFPTNTHSRHDDTRISRTTELIVLYCNEENLLDDIPTLVDILKP